MAKKDLPESLIRDRVEHWPQALSAACEAARDKPHVWGEHDCATFAADCILAITGQDVMGVFRDRYTSPLGAARVIKNEGYSSLEDMVASFNETCDPQQCRRGDVVICEGEHGDFLAVVMGHYAVAPSPTGLVQVHLKFAKRGFRV